MGKKPAEKHKHVKVSTTQPPGRVEAWREQARRRGQTLSAFLDSAVMAALDDDLAVAMSERCSPGRPDEGRRMAIRNDLTGDTIHVDVRTPLTRSRLIRWRTSLGATPECDALGGHGPQVDQDRYDRLLAQAERMNSDK